MSNLGVVVIGRNEGERLAGCLRSVARGVRHAIYVDSGSSDGSPERSRELGADVVELDLQQPFTAARARNAGFERLMELAPDLEFVFFVDGDCEVVEGFIPTALAWLEGNADFVLVTGRRIERHPEASRYNRLCDMEWNTPVGECSSSGGDAVMRCGAFRNAGMFNPTMIAGEEPELCVRLRQHGGRLLRLDQDMTVHDATMTRASQWWKRCERAGHAYAEGMALHGFGPPWHNTREVIRIVAWGAVVPAAVILGAISARWYPGLWIVPVAGAGLYMLLWLRVYRGRRRRGDSTADSRLYATFVLLGRLPEFKGILSYWMRRAFGRARRRLIEYK